MGCKHSLCAPHDYHKIILLYRNIGLAYAILQVIAHRTYCIAWLCVPSFWLGRVNHRTVWCRRDGAPEHVFCIEVRCIGFNNNHHNGCCFSDVRQEDDDECCVEGQGAASSSAAMSSSGNPGTSTDLRGSKRAQATPGADITQQPWYEYVLETENAADKAVQKRAKDRMRRALRLQSHQNKRGTKCRSFTPDNR